VASLAGAVLTATNGLGGMRDSAGRLRFCPRLPADVPGASFAVTVRGAPLRIRIDALAERPRPEQPDGRTPLERGEAPG
jgi:alpha,alpha-trehalose phosphorylase